MKVKSRMRTSPFHIYQKARELAGYVTGEDKLLPAFASSDISIYPYQVAAAMFALRSPYLKGVILADEGSLGKTYEALLIATQRWYEGRNKQLIILPANLVRQWIEKIESGFTVPFVVAETEEDFDKPAIVITTYDFAVSKAEHIAKVPWDLVIYDEASLLSKGYTGDNKTATALKGATYNAFKILLTPTPITISIMDIYGLLWFIDETIVPDEKWFYDRYFRKPENYGELSGWVSKYCFRTLKSQVADYVNFTNRIPYTKSYELSSQEKEVYQKLDEYLALPKKEAYPAMDRYDLTLMLYHTLSSSPQAFLRPLQAAIARTSDEGQKAMLQEIHTLTKRVFCSGKERAFAEVLDSIGTRKAIVFTNNRTTQKILADKYLNSCMFSTENLKKFREDPELKIMFATDEAARGLDIEFCPVVINYDLLYNAIEMEQRITRCHRQGQRSDVLVVNLLSKDNFADVRILELINKRVLQFEGIFGLSDDILGNFDTNIAEVLRKLRPAKEIETAFKENLLANKDGNKDLVRNAETTLFTSFTSEVANSVKLTPDYIEDKIEVVNSMLWEVVSWFFEDFNEQYETQYKIDYRRKTITSIDGKQPTLFYYNTGSRNRPYKSMREYGMSTDFKPHTGRITLTSALGRGTLDEVGCADYGTIQVDADIEPCMIGYYCVTVDGQDYFSFVGETEAGVVLSDQACRDIMELNVLSYNEKNEGNNKRRNYNSRNFVFSSVQPFKVDTYVDSNTFIGKHLSEKDSALAEHVSLMRHKIAIAKSALERDTENLKVDIKKAERELAEAVDRLKRIQADKQVKVLKNELRKKEDSIFMDRMRLDLQLEQDVEALKSRKGLKAQVQRHYLINVCGK